MKIGLIGYGYWGKFVARAIARVGELAVICDPTADAQIAAITDWAHWGTHVTGSPELFYRECDAVWVATPTVTHYGIVMDALRCGKHVLCEKPFVTNPSEAAELVSFARELGVVLMVGHLQLYTSGHAFARRIMEAPTGGRPEEITIVRRNTKSSLSDGSVLWGIGPHDIAALIDLFGTSWEVEGCTGTTHRVDAAISFEGGVRATIELDWLAEERARVFMVGTNNVASMPNAVEPLLAETREFVELVTEEHEPHQFGKIIDLRDDAVNVTLLLARMSEIMTKVRATE